MLNEVALCAFHTSSLSLSPSLSLSLSIYLSTYMYLYTCIIYIRSYTCIYLSFSLSYRTIVFQKLLVNALSTVLSWFSRRRGFSFEPDLAANFIHRPVSHMLLLVHGRGLLHDGPKPTYHLFHSILNQ